MYRGNNNKSSMNYFYDFTNINNEQLFYIIYPLIEDRLVEIIEQKILEIVEQKIKITVETYLNGRLDDLSGLREDLQQRIIEALKK